ncbi:MAG: amidohydrolase family protein [Gemmobacter sp.]
MRAFPDLMLTGGAIRTLHPAHPRAKALAVTLEDVSQHDARLSPAALAAAGIGATMSDPDGGHVEGNPTGILIDSVVSPVVPFLEPTAAQLDRAVLRMAGHFDSLGLTGFKEPMPLAPERAAAAGADPCHPVRALRDAGAGVIHGSDRPSAAPDADPWVGLAGMIRRADPFGRHPGHVGADQAIAPGRALRPSAANAARAMRRESMTVRLAAGLSADPVVLDRAPETPERAALAALRPSATLFEGRVVHGDL